MIQITDKEFKLLSEFIQQNYGIVVKKEKRALITGRLHSLLTDLGMSDFTEYYEYLMKDKSGKSLLVLVDRISTNHTFFMREPDHFYFFRDVILPDLVNRLKDRDLRIWCAAAATGEEPYTLAMIVRDQLKNMVPAWDSRMLATDISDSALNTARAGIYTKERIDSLPKLWKTIYFKSQNAESMVISDEIKKEIIFRRFNLMDEVFPFKKKFHVIFCRNVMIYFDQKTKDILIDKLYDFLEPGGYLLIGHSESIARESTKFKYVKPAIYRK